MTLASASIGWFSLPGVVEPYIVPKVDSASKDPEVRISDDSGMSCIVSEQVIN
jgi:hypothetical protein